MIETKDDTSKISIVLPTYNGARYLTQAVENCLTQDYGNIELLIVDDASTDETAQIVAGIDDCRVTKLRHEKNQGLPTALNTGFAQATGDYLTWTSDDNLFGKHALTTMAEHLGSSRDIGFVYADYWLIDEQSNIIGFQEVEVPDTLLMRCSIGPCFLYRREVYERIGNYDPQARLFEDYEYWLRVSQKFVMRPIHKPLYYYRVHGGSLTGNPGVIHTRWRKSTQMKRQRFNLPWRDYWLEMSRIDIDEAFARYQWDKYEQVPFLTLRGAARNPAWLFNRGVVAVTIRSLLRQLATRQLRNQRKR